MCIFCFPLFPLNAGRESCMYVLLPQSHSYPLDTTCRHGILLKALVWFWIIDETLVLTSMLSVCRLNEVGTCQVMEQVMIMVTMVMTTR